MRRLLRPVAVVLGCGLALLPAGMPAAQASSPCTTTTTSGHCYGTLRTPVSNEGGALTIQTNCMSIPSLSTNLMTNEMWVTKSGSYWTEVGMTLGAKNGGGYVSAVTYYWADNRPGTGGYHEHYFSGPVPLSTPVSASIIETSNGSGSWNVKIGANSGTSTSNFAGPSDRIDTGTESSDTAGHSYGRSGSLAYYNSSRTKVSGYGAGTLSVAGNAHAEWITKYTLIGDGQGATC